MNTKITPAQIFAWNPCQAWRDPDRVARAFAGRELATPLEVLRAGLEGRITPQDALWVVCHEGILDDMIFRHSACDSAEYALQRMRDTGIEPDPRSVQAVEVARRHAEGLATREELAAAEAAARAAARAATWAAAWAAAWASTWAAEAAAVAAARADERRRQIAVLIRLIEESENAD